MWLVGVARGVAWEQCTGGSDKLKNKNSLYVSISRTPSFPPSSAPSEISLDEIMENFENIFDGE